MKKNPLPPLIMTSEIGSFAHQTIRERYPQIIDQILLSENLPPKIHRELQVLKAELINGQVNPLQEETHDRGKWQRDMQPWLGKQWSQLPWLMAEAYFYRRVLEITGYFQPGPLMKMDPFEQQKWQEISTGRTTFEEHFIFNQENSFDVFHKLILNALWGNRGDLSMVVTLDTRMDSQNDCIILDHSQDAYHHLSETQPGKIAYFLDNVGKELYFDLALLDYLLETGLANQVTCFAKNQPFFISDVMAKDFTQTIAYLAESEHPNVQHLSKRLINALKIGKLKVEAPALLTYGHTFREMPVALHRIIKTFDTAILKGDLNYRRLMGDRHWPPTTPIAEAGGYFPAPFLSLRTLKAELIVGLTDDVLVKIIQEADSNWLTNGKRGLITFFNYRH